jgi:hypothetical protein
MVLVFPFGIPLSELKHHDGLVQFHDFKLVHVPETVEQGVAVQAPIALVQAVVQKFEIAIVVPEIQVKIIVAFRLVNNGIGFGVEGVGVLPL